MLRLLIYRLRGYGYGYGYDNDNGYGYEILFVLQGTYVLFFLKTC